MNEMKKKKRTRPSLLKVEQRKREEAATALLDLDRKVSTVSNRLEELKSMLEQVDRARRHLEQEVSDTTEHIFILTETSARLSQENSNLNMDLQNLQVSICFEFFMLMQSSSLDRKR